MVKILSRSSPKSNQLLLVTHPSHPRPPLPPPKKTCRETSIQADILGGCKNSADADRILAAPPSENWITWLMSYWQPQASHLHTITVWSNSFGFGLLESRALFRRLLAVSSRKLLTVHYTRISHAGMTKYPTRPNRTTPGPATVNFEK